MMKSKIAFLLILISPFISNAQDSLLTLDNAIKNALESNFDVQIYSSMNAEAKNNATAGNAGMLPNADVSGGYVKSVSSIDQKYSSGSEIKRDGSGSSVLSMDAGITWTIFDGMKMFYTRDKLSSVVRQSDQQLKIQIENTIESIISAYYSIIKNRQDLKAVREELTLSEDRLKIAERKLNNGSGSKLDMLLAKTDFNKQKSIELTTQSQLDAAMIELNRLMAKPLENKYQTEDSVIISYRPDIQQMKKELESKNATVALFEINSRIAELSLKESQSMRWPKIALSSHYVYNKTKNDAGFSLYNQSNGYNYGITATLPLFHGFNITRQIRNSRSEVLQAKLELSSIKEQISAELLNSYRNFSNQLELLKMEEENITFAREILNVAQERYRLGISSTLEMQDAQRVFEESVSRLTTARYNTKLSETRLRRLNGELVK